MIGLNKYIGIGFALGLLAVSIAVILIFNQYSLSSLVNNKACKGNYSINAKGDVLLVINNTGNANANASVLIYQHVPQTNITIPQEYYVSLAPFNVTILMYGQVMGMVINCTSTRMYISVYLLKRPIYYIPLWLIMLISFILSIALIIIGYLTLVESRIKPRSRSNY
ncbi:MAG: hypothetical protein ACP5L1_09210 [Caldivirga sp.]